MMVTPPLLTLTQEAQSELDRYLRRVKVALRTHPSVDADEVERDVRGHIEADLAESPMPITEDRLRRVLDRLGSPNQWVPTDELPIWRRLLVSLRSGPEDWRLAYVTFALFVAGPLVGPVGPLFFFASVPMARATLALLEEQGEPVGARRWLVYPPLALTYVAIALASGRRRAARADCDRGGSVRAHRSDRLVSGAVLAKPSVGGRTGRRHLMDDARSVALAL